MANDVTPVPRRSLNEQLGEELAGRSWGWWRDKLRKERVRAKTAEDNIEVARAEIRDQTTRADAAERKVTEFTELNGRLEHEKHELEAALASIDPDSVFEYMIRRWEDELNELDREIP